MVCGYRDSVQISQEIMLRKIGKREWNNKKIYCRIPLTQKDKSWYRYWQLLYKMGYWIFGRRVWLWEEGFYTEARVAKPWTKIRYYKDVPLCENYVRDFFIAAILPVSVKFNAISL
jgi:hypothetical protein